LLLDIMLPGIDGLSLLRHRRADQPVILITARAALCDKVLGLNLGADDYIVKPFETLEVIARVQAVLRRNARNETTFSIDDTRVDLTARQAFVNGVPVELTPQEFALTEILIVNRNLALSREKLLELAWGFDYMGDTRTVDLHIQRVRKKLSLTDKIVTVYKLGYRLETPR
jgi:DNA-binding response OmpR family regulator